MEINVKKLKPGHFEKDGKPEKVSSYGNVVKPPEKKNILLTVLLSLVTLGIYSSFWYLKRSVEFNSLVTRKKLSSTLPTVAIVNSIVFIASIIIFAFTITEDMVTTVNYITTFQIIILSIVGITFLLKLFFGLLLAFYSRTILKQAVENKRSFSKVSALFTLFFCHWYLQYEINKIIDDKEKNPKTGPWVFFILEVLIIVGIIVWRVFL